MSVFVDIYEDLVARSRYLRQGLLITSRSLLRGVITYPCLRYLLLATRSSYMRDNKRSCFTPPGGECVYPALQRRVRRLWWPSTASVCGPDPRSGLAPGHLALRRRHWAQCQGQMFKVKVTLLHLWWFTLKHDSFTLKPDRNLVGGLMHIWHQDINWKH